MSKSGRRKPPLVAEKRYASGAKKRPSPGKKPAPKKKPAKSRRARSPKKARNPIVAFFMSIFGFVFGIIWGFGWRAGMVIGLLIALAVGYYYATLPDVSQLLDGRARGSVTMLDREGEVFAWRGDQFGGVVTTDTVSKHLKNAVIATEDKRFYGHFGLSPRGIASAVRINLREGRGPLSGHGGSTITQQTSKLLCLGIPYDPEQWEDESKYESYCRQGTIWRKVKEAIYSMAMEVKYTKDEILTIYLNRAFLGAGARGFEAASQRYFGKSAASVTPAEAAMLAGLLKAPTRYAPTNSLQRAQDRAAVIVALMKDQGYLSDNAAAQAIANPAQLSKAARAKAGGYFADWVMSEAPSFWGRKTAEDVVLSTTLDQRIQQAAEDALKHVFDNKVSEGSVAQAAIVVMSADGAVRAMVGGRATKVAGAFNRASQAKRQTGSAFKPFVYATALDLGYTKDDIVVDAPLTINTPGSGPWSPKNYTNKHYGEVSLTWALQNSLNIPAVKISEAVGRDKVRKVASDFGIRSDLALGPALALGASESTLIEMTGAYAGILNGGSSVTPYGLEALKLLGDDQPLMGISGGIGERVISQGAARELIWMMEKVVSEGTGKRAALPGWQVAGKTGTTQAARDAWFVGFTADYVAGVWMGNDNNDPLNQVTGGGLPAEIWRETMSRIHAGEAPKPLPMAVRAQTKPTPEAKSKKRSKDPVGNLLKKLFGGN